MALTTSPDVSAAHWIVAHEQPWQRLVQFGPSGFAAYARLRFIPDPAFAGQSENDIDLGDDRPSETAQLRAALEVLAGHTRTPEDCYFCLWDGWGWGVEGDVSAWTTLRNDKLPTSPKGPVLAPAQPPAPKFGIPNRDYFQFHGSVSDLGGWGAAQNGPGRSSAGVPDPAFIWPADHAWCVAKDVDPHWAGIGADTEAIAQLIAHPDLDVVPANPDEEQPHYL